MFVTVPRAVLGIGFVQHSPVKAEYSGFLDEEYLQHLVERGVEVLSESPLEFNIKASTQELQILLRFLVDKVHIITLEVRPQTLYGRFFQKFQTDS